MLKATYWIRVVSAPILLLSAGCSLTPRSHATVKRGLPPDRLMAMAKALENKGHLSQAKVAYLQVLEAQPDYPGARQSLDTLIANEGNPERLNRGRKPLAQSQQMLAKSKPAAEKKTRSLAAEEDTTSTGLASAGSTKRSNRIKPESNEESNRLSPDNRVEVDPFLASGTAASSSVEMYAYGEDGLRVSVDDTRRQSSDSMLANSQDRNSYADPSISAHASNGADQTRFAEEPTESSPFSESSAIAAQRSETSEDEFFATTSPSQSTGQPSGDALRSDNDLLQLKDPELLDAPIDELIADSSTSVPTADPDSEEDVTSQAKSVPQVAPDLRSIPQSSDTIEIANNVQLRAGEISEEVQFEKPIVRFQRNLDQSLEPFFGPFHAAMVQDLRANREQFQDKLVAVVTDQDADPEMRSRAVFLLGSIGSAAVDVLPALRREMHYDVDEYLRVDLCEAILKIHPEDEDALKVLVDSLEESDQNLRWIAAFALRNAVSPRTTFVIDSLRRSINPEDLKLCRMIYLILAEFGPAAESAIPELLAALESSDPATREVAKASLACIAPDRKTTQEIQKLSHQNGLP